MNQADFDLLKASIWGNNVVLHCIQGARIVAEVHSVSEEDQDVIVDVISSNRPEIYDRFDSKAFLIPFSDINSVEPYPGDGDKSGAG